MEAAPEAVEDTESENGSAAEGQKAAADNAQQTTYRYWVNPTYEGVISQEVIDSRLEALKAPQVETQEAPKTFTTVKAAGKYLRGQLKQRKTKVTLVLKINNSNHDSLWSEVYEEAVKETGVPVEGDYIFGNVLGYGNSWSTGKKDKKTKKNVNTLCYNIEFAANAAQEKQADAAVKAVLKQLNLKKDSDFVKLHKIYNYICANVTYDYEGNENHTTLCHSAYAAIVKHKAVCQGYATLLYRMLMECGVPCRYITSKEHAWNIVKLDGKYYNVDSTWDSENYHSDQYYEWFLLSDENFAQDEPDHVREAQYLTKAFKKECPMSRTNGDYHYWDVQSIEKKPYLSGWESGC